MVRIVNGLGSPVHCKSCNSELNLSSKDDYKGCYNCGFENDLTPKFHWYDNLWLWFFCASFILYAYFILFHK